jgi:hypothetical protein
LLCIAPMVPPLPGCTEELQQAMTEGLPENWASREIIFSTGFWLPPSDQEIERLG